MTQGNIILQGLSLSEFESLLKKWIAEIKQEVAVTKEHVSSQNEKRFLTRKEAAKRLNLSLPTLAKYSRNRLIPFYKIGTRVLYKAEEIEDSLKTISQQKFKT